MSLEEIKALRNNPNEYFKQLLLNIDKEEIMQLYDKEISQIGYHWKITHDDDFLNFLMNNQINGYIINHIGFYYKNKKEDYYKAIKYYRKAMKLNNSYAFYNIGNMYYIGHGYKQSYKKALKYYEKAIKLNNSTAFKEIGGMYENGQYVERDYNKAMEYYQEAANFNNAIAINNIGVLYYYGRSVTQSYEKALTYFIRSLKIQYNEEIINNIINSISNIKLVRLPRYHDVYSLPKIIFDRLNKKQLHMKIKIHKSPIFNLLLFIKN